MATSLPIYGNHQTYSGTITVQPPVSSPYIKQNKKQFAFNDYEISAQTIHFKTENTKSISVDQLNHGLNDIEKLKEYCIRLEKQLEEKGKELAMLEGKVGMLEAWMMLKDAPDVPEQGG